MELCLSYYVSAWRTMKITITAATSKSKEIITIISQTVFKQAYNSMTTDAGEDVQRHSNKRYNLLVTDAIGRNIMTFSYFCKRINEITNTITHTALLSANFIKQTVTRHKNRHQTVWRIFWDDGLISDMDLKNDRLLSTHNKHESRKRASTNTRSWLPQQKLILCMLSLHTFCNKNI